MASRKSKVEEGQRTVKSNNRRSSRGAHVQEDHTALPVQGDAATNSSFQGLFLPSDTRSGYGSIPQSLGGTTQASIYGQDEGGLQPSRPSAHPACETSALNSLQLSGSQRTDWAMWVGNLPSRVTESEVFDFFSQTGPSSSSTSVEDLGVVSVRVIERSLCAFVNYASEAQLLAAVTRFHGQPLRYGDPHCPELVCKIRTREDDERAGVGAQRGTGLHRDWVKEKLKQQQDVKETDFATGSRGNTSTPDEVDLESDGSSPGFNTTTSSFLTSYFPARYFILKCFSHSVLEESVTTGYWSTQSHNEETLDQAFRTSKDVYLIFSENKSRGFFGYARMVGGIAPPKFGEETQGPRPRSAPPELGRRHSQLSLGEPPDDFRSLCQDVGRDPAQTSNLESNSSPVPLYLDIASPRAQTPETAFDVGPNATPRGTPFQIMWIKTQKLPFTKTKHITNPWFDNREVKISRDGTEVEPEAGKMLLEEWDKLSPIQGRGKLTSPVGAVEPSTKSTKDKRRRPLRN